MKRELKRSVWCGMTPKCTVVAMWEGWTWCQSWQQPSQHIFKEAKESWESPWRITTTTLWQQQLGKSQLYWLPKWLQLQIHTLPVYLVCIKPRNKRILWSLKKTSRIILSQGSSWSLLWLSIPDGVWHDGEVSDEVKMILGPLLTSSIQ